jgi:hypothetical protein
MKNFIPNKLNEILILSSKNNMEFVYQKEGEENFIEFSIEPERKITINIVNEKDKNLKKLINKKFEDLNQLFK